MAVTIGDGKIPPEVVRAAADQTLPLNPADAVHVRLGVRRTNTYIEHITDYLQPVRDQQGWA